MSKTDFMCRYKNCHQSLSLLSDGYCQKHDNLLADLADMAETKLSFLDYFVRLMPWKKN